MSNDLTGDLYNKVNYEGSPHILSPTKGLRPVIEWFLTVYKLLNYSSLQ